MVAVTRCATREVRAITRICAAGGDFIDQTQAEGMDQHKSHWCHCMVRYCAPSQKLPQWEWKGVRYSVKLPNATWPWAKLVTVKFPRKSPSNHSSEVNPKNSVGKTIQCHKPSPSHHHVDRWYKPWKYGFSGRNFSLESSPKTTTLPRLGIGRLVKDINSAVAVAACLVPHFWPLVQRKAVHETSCA